MDGILYAFQIDKVEDTITSTTTPAGSSSRVNDDEDNGEQIRRH